MIKMRVPLVEALKKVGRRAAPALGLGLGLGLMALRARADEVASVERAEAPLLVVTVAEIAGSDVDDRAAGTVAVHVRESGARVKVVRHAGGALEMRRLLVDAQALAKQWDARGVIWIDVGRGGDAAVYLLERGASQIFGRKLAAPAVQASAAIESLANIAGSAAAELLEGRVVGLAKVAIAATEGAAPPDAPVAEASGAPGASSTVAAPGAASPVPTTSPAKGADAGAGASAPASARGVEAPRTAAGPAAITASSSTSSRARAPASTPDLEALRWPRVALSAGYTGNSFGLGVPWQNAVSLFAALSPSRDGWVGLGYDVAFPQHIGDPHMRIELARHPVIVAGGYRFALAGSWDFQVGARFTVDFATLRFEEGFPAPQGAPRPPPPPPRLDVVLSAAPVLGVGFGITDRVRASIFGGIDVPFTEMPALGSGPLRGVEPSPVRLLVGASLQVDVVVPGAAPRVQAARR